jgi:hypothetical protein
MENKEILNILQKAAGAKFSFNSKGEIWLSGSIAHCSESEGISEEKYINEVYPKMKSLLESIPWTKTVENPRNPKGNEYPEENGWYITMLDCNEHEILVNRFEKGDSGWSFYNKTHVKWWMPLTDELKHGITELVDMITEDRVTFEIAKLLRDKGFPQNIEHDAWYVVKEFSTGCHWNSCTYKVGDITREYDEKCCIVMPTLQMVMKWLREKHNLFVFPFPQMNTNKFWTEIYQLSDNQEWENLYYESIDLQDYSTYEEACEAAIKYCLENLI